MDTSLEFTKNLGYYNKPVRVHSSSVRSDYSDMTGSFYSQQNSVPYNSLTDDYFTITDCEIRNCCYDFAFPYVFPRSESDMYEGAKEFYLSVEKINHCNSLVYELLLPYFTSSELDYTARRFSELLMTCKVGSWLKAGDSESSGSSGSKRRNPNLTLERSYVYSFEDPVTSHPDEELRGPVSVAALLRKSDTPSDSSSEIIEQPTKEPYIVQRSNPLLESKNKLEAFRASPVLFANNSLYDIQGSIVDFSRDQHGSRFIQQKMEKGGDLELVFTEITASDSVLYSLMIDVFGNYVVQKLLEFGAERHRTHIATHLQGRVLGLTTQMYGCRVIQKAIETVGEERQRAMIQELFGNVLACVKDQNGNHVIQKCIEHVPPAQLDFIVEEFSTKIFELSSHPYGCRVIQRLMEHCSAAQTHGLMLEIYENVPTLVKDQYGNYVVQHVVDNRKHETFPDRIIQYVFDHIFALSSHKFASNVVEKCIQTSSREQREQLVRQLLSNSNDPEAENLFLMMKDPFANYVVQKIVDVMTGDLRKQLLLRMRPFFQNLRRLTFGKHMLTKVERWQKELDDMNVGKNEGETMTLGR